MPLIRYNMGDVVSKTDDSCPCGREFPVIKSIIGKEGDIIQSPSGVRLGVTAVMQILYTIGGTDNILETQFIQDAPDHVVIEYVPGRKFTENDSANMRKSASRFFPRDLKVDFRKVKAVKKTPMGKVMPIVSQIAQ